MRFILPILSALLCLSLTSCLKPPKKNTKTLRVPPIKVISAKSQNITQHFETAGQLKADQEVLISAERAGKIENILVEEGSWVQAGQVLITTKNDDLGAELKLAKANYEARQALYKEGAISKLDLIQYQSKLENLQAQFDNSVIRARISGQVGRIYIDLGDYLKLGDPIMDLTKIHPLRLSYQVVEKLIPIIHVGQTVSFSTDAYPEKEFTAKITFIDPKVNPQNRSILVRAEVQDTEYTLKPNQFVTVKQTIKNEKHIVIPEQAVFLDQGQVYVYLAKDIEEKDLNAAQKILAPGAEVPTHKVSKVKVKLGIREEDRVAIIEGLQEEDQVIFAGLQKIYPTALVYKQETEK